MATLLLPANFRFMKSLDAHHGKANVLRLERHAFKIVIAMTHLHTDRFVQLLTYLFLFCGLSACTTIQNQIPQGIYSPATQPLPAHLLNDESKANAADFGYLVGPGLCSASSRKTAFFVSLSGGGSRAAYFSARVLHELDLARSAQITPHIDGIFSVSGGSLTAALYGMSRDGHDKIDDANVQGNVQLNTTLARPVWSEELTDKALTKQLAWSMASDLVKPVNLLPYFFWNLSRTDLLQQSIETQIFGNTGAPLTFQSLNKQRPPVYILAANATVGSDNSYAPQAFGSLFIFATPDFVKIGDDLDSVSLARAVSASAAFPGVFSPVSFPRYRLSPREKQLGMPRFVHLIDGGNADNLALLGVKRALLENDHRLLKDCDNIVVLSVDAFGNQGFHKDSEKRATSPVGLVFDHKSVLASFDALFAANRARLLGEFKSRIFVPPANEELCWKDGLPDEVCHDGETDWGEINSLIKQKLYFVHLNFDSPEFSSQTRVQCIGAEPVDDMRCEVKPVNDARLACEQRNLRKRLKEIPTTFGLSDAEREDIRVFVSMLNHPKNICLNHLSDILSKGVRHEDSFYEFASASCDETHVMKRGVGIIKEKRQSNENPLVLARDAGAGKYENKPEEDCSKFQRYSHAEKIKFLHEVKSNDTKSVLNEAKIPVQKFSAE